MTNNETPSDYYAILEIPRTATLDEVKTGYKKQALKWHPDRHPPDNKITSEERFKLVFEAYQVLYHPESRKNYDAKLARQEQEVQRAAQQQRQQQEQQQRQRKSSAGAAAASFVPPPRPPPVKLVNPHSDAAYKYFEDEFGPAFFEKGGSKNQIGYADPFAAFTALWAGQGAFDVALKDDPEQRAMMQKEIDIQQQRHKAQMEQQRREAAEKEQKEDQCVVQ